MERVEWSGRARKQLKRIPRPYQSVILEATRELVRFPDTPNVKRLINHHYQYRLRIGRYRVFFDIHEEIRIVRIQEVRKRDDRTY